MLGRLGFESALTAGAAPMNNNDNPMAKEKDVRFICSKNWFVRMRSGARPNSM